MTAGALIAVLTCVAYLPAMQGGFIWDDDELVTDNALVHAPDGLFRLWFTDQPIDYWPLTYTSFWLEWRLWGMHPNGYHVTNVLLHIAAAFLIWTILRRLSIPGAFLAALLFAVHPVNVESVAWIAQRKNTLAMVFFLLSILWYLSAEERREKSSNWLWYGLSLLAFLLAMLSKGSVAVLPVLLLGIIWWQRRRITAADLLRTTPFFVVAIILAAVNVWFQKHGADAVFREANFGQRLSGAGAAVWFYLGQALAPINLIFVYPQWSIETKNLLWWLPPIAAAMVTALLWLRRNSPCGRAFLFAWGFFCVALAPVMGFTDVYFMKYSLVADHYEHIAIIAVVALVAAGWSLWRSPEAAPWITTAAAAIVVAGLALMTFRQNQMYENAFTLYQTTLDKNPACWMAHNELGSLYAATGRTNEAIQEYQQSLRFKPDHAIAYNNLGLQLSQLGRTAEAIQYFQQALQLDPKLAAAHVNLGTVLLDKGQLPEAIEQYQLAVELKPYLSESHYGLGLALARSGRPGDAIAQYLLALQLKPESSETLAGLAFAYAQAQHPAEAISAAEKAMLVAQSQGQTALVQQLQTWLTNYRSQHLKPPKP